ncbi:MAG: HEAT repeat domain-containing protein [Pirellulales bacterium]
MFVLSVVSTLGSAQEASSDLVLVIVNLLGEEDKDLRSLGLEQVRTGARGSMATKIFSEQLPKLSHEAQIGLLNALAIRADSVARPEVVKLLTSSQEEKVQNSAIRALGSLGNVTDLPQLLKLLATPSEEQQSAVRASLERLSGDTVSSSLADVVSTLALTEGSSNIRVILIRILAERRSVDAIPQLLAAAVDDETSVRIAAMTALGQLANSHHLAGMVQGVLRTKSGPERTAAEKNVMFVCVRIADVELRAQPLLAAMGELSETDRLALYSTLGRVGGGVSLKIIEGAIDDPNPKVHQIGIRAISNWPNATVASKLMELVKTDVHPAHRIAMLRALIRVAPLPDQRPLAEKLGLLQKAMEMATRDQEQRLVLRRASAIRIIETLRFIVAYVDDPKLAQQACASLVELAHHRGLREPHKEEFHRALDRVIQTSDNATVIDRAQRYKKDQTWVRAKTE